MNNRAASNQPSYAGRAAVPSATMQNPMLCCRGHQRTFPPSDDSFIIQLSEQLSAVATFIFPVGDIKFSCVGEGREFHLLHNEVMCHQTRLLAFQVEAMNRVFVISNIYSHPLVPKDEILKGHQIVSFAGTPVRNVHSKTIGTVCAIDFKERYWNAAEIKALKEIAARIEDCQL